MKNDQMIVTVKVQPEAVTGSVQVMVLCDEIEGERRQWHHVESVRWSRPANKTTRAGPKIVLGPGIGTTSKRVADPRTTEPSDAGSDAEASSDPDD